jgi:hypothetical protein
MNLSDYVKLNQEIRTIRAHHTGFFPLKRRTHLKIHLRLWRQKIGKWPGWRHILKER